MNNFVQTRYELPYYIIGKQIIAVLTGSLLLFINITVINSEINNTSCITLKTFFIEAF